MAENLSNYKLSNGVMIPSLGFGTWQTPSGKVAIDSVKEALEAGYRHIDTAQMYENEESVGTGIKESNIPREEIFITSKLRNTTRGYEETIKAVNESLEKLQTDYADLFLIHWPNPISSRERWKEANAESWRAFEDLYKEGKLRSIGVSNFMPHHLDALAETAAITPMVNQIRLCPGDEPLETIQYCNDNHILLEAYSPLGTGRIFHIPELKELSTRYNKTIAQISLRWSLQKGYLPLPKSVTSNRIKENIEVYDFEISEKDMELLSGLESPFEKPVRPDEITW
jgi:diketogulonate reductase-like aldo/keto reductase